MSGRYSKGSNKKYCGGAKIVFDIVNVLLQLANFQIKNNEYINAYVTISIWIIKNISLHTKILSNDDIKTKTL